MTLFELGKKVSALKKRCERQGQIGVVQDFALAHWLTEFDGILPPRFSSHIAENLLLIQQEYHLRVETNFAIRSFLRTHPQLFTPPQAKYTRRPA